MQIIGGIVSYEDGVKETVQGDQFSPTRKVRVELNFSLDAGDANGSCDTAIQAVLDKAQAFVNGKLALTKPTAAAAATVKAAELKPEAAPKAAPKAPRAPAKVKEAAPQVDLEELTGAPGPTKADLEKAAGVPAGGLPSKGDLKLVDDALEVSKPVAPTTDTNDLSDLMGAAEAKKYTDADLNDLAQNTMQRINTADNPGGPRIRKLVSEYLPAGVQPVMAKIPADKRGEFADKMKELK